MTRTVKETAKTGSSVGNAVTATDADNDPLLYTLTRTRSPLPLEDNAIGATDGVPTVRRTVTATLVLTPLRHRPMALLTTMVPD